MYLGNELEIGLSDFGEKLRSTSLITSNQLLRGSSKVGPQILALVVGFESLSPSKQ